jgi:hypothetical protein
MSTAAELAPIADTSRRLRRRQLLRPLAWSILAARAAELAPMLDSDYTVVRSWNAPAASYLLPAVRA